MSQLTDQMIRRAGSEPLKSASVTEDISVVIPTYRREQVLLDTLEHLMALSPAPNEILVIDQTANHEAKTEAALQSLNGNGLIRWIRLDRPSITTAMNVGLKEARCGVVLFLDDDIIPHPNLVAAHLSAHGDGHNTVAGQVLQPGEEPLPGAESSEPFHFASGKKQVIKEVMGGNFSIKRKLAIDIGGFDENFVHVAYRFEAEFAGRLLESGESILFSPMASIRHLKTAHGGTRSFGHHLRTIRPSHSVGAYYFLLRSKNVHARLLNGLKRSFNSVKTKHHFRRPWWIPVTLVAELIGFAWAVGLYLRGPRLLKSTIESVRGPKV